MTHRFTYCILFAFLLLDAASAQRITKYVPIDIPVRDGKTLAADLYALDTTAAKPVVLIQTPYNKNYYRLMINIPPQAGGAPFPYDSLNYNYVIVDWRGFYGSKSADVPGYDRGLDGYDIVEWIARRPWSNGKIGTWGPSALGAIQFQTAKHHPPHLVCCVPLVKDFKTKYTDYYYGGDYRKEHVESLAKLGFFATTQTILSHPDEDLVWKTAAALTDYPDSIGVPLLMIGGWFDHFPDDLLRAFDDLRTRSDPAVRSSHKMIVGPWLHTAVDQAEQGALTFPNAVSVADSAARRFFDYELRGAKNNYPNEPVMCYYQMGANEWRTTSDWSALARFRDTLYLAEGGALLRALPVTAGADTLRADPKNPVPAVGGSRFNPFDRTILLGPQDLRAAVESRPDVLTFTTPPFPSGVELDGPVSIRLFVSCDRTDADYSARLCDVYPDGRSMILTQGIRRARFRNSFSTEALMTPGETALIPIDLQNIAQTFPAGHRLRIDIAGSDYPHFDLNLNDGGPMYTGGDTLVATSLIRRDAQYPSRVILAGATETRTPVAPQAAEDFRLEQNYPNPFTGETTIRFTLPRSAPAAGSGPPYLRIFDLLGRLVLDLSDRIPQGAVTIRRDQLPAAGVYFYQLGDSRSRKTGAIVHLR